MPVALLSQSSQIELMARHTTVISRFVHYCRYISTYYARKGVNYGAFKRDVLFFKVVGITRRRVRIASLNR